MADADLLSALLPPPSEDDTRLIGSVRGELEGLGAGLEVWCGAAVGWRPLGALASPTGSLVRHEGRLRLALTFDLGEAPPLRRRGLGDEHDGA
jgi:hypothetical protein